MQRQKKSRQTAKVPDSVWLIQALEGWYAGAKRELPWRLEPTPYHVWLSEIMLQQTRVEAVKGYYDRFLSALPTIEALANAPEEQLLKLWEGLGYYNRVRNLKTAARTIMQQYDGEMPDCYEEIIKLKGIGAYTAGAIASIAFGEAVSAVDGNVLRVISRLLGSDKDIAAQATKQEIKEWLDSIMPLSHPATFNQALMELGAIVCIPNGEPRCAQCPWEAVCVAHQEGLTDVIPVKKKAAKRRVEKKTVILLFKGNRVALVKRQEKGLLAGMWQFPMLDGYLTLHDTAEQVYKLVGSDFDIRSTCQAKHIFSHVEWQMKGRVVKLAAKQPTIQEAVQTATKMQTNRARNGVDEPELCWATLDEMETEYSIPSAFAAYREIVRRELGNA